MGTDEIGAMNLESNIHYGHRLLPQVIDASAAENPVTVVGMMAKSANISKGFTYVSIGDVAHAVDFMAHWLVENVPTNVVFETVAYLGENDFRYWAIQFGGMKCSRKVLLPSTRNSIANTLSLLEALNCKTVIYASSQKHVAVEISRSVEVRILAIPSWKTMIAAPAKEFPYTKTWDEARDDPVLVLHTSGSTGNPTPITYNHAFLGFFDAIRKVPKVEGVSPHNIARLHLGPKDYFYLGFPLFHIVGLTFALRPIFYEGVVVIGPSHAVQNSEIVASIMAAVSCTAIALPPSLLEDTVKFYKDKFLRNSKKLRQVLYGGGPLAKSTGDWLSKRVPEMCQIYGQTEIAMPPLLVPEAEDWRHFRFHPTHSAIEMEPTNDSEGHYELILNRNVELCWLQPVFEIFPDLQQWRTKDLFLPHRHKPDLWIFKGRKDDTIVLSNAEKFNPVTAEGIIQGHPDVKGALIIGTGRFQCGLLIEPQTHGDDRELIEKFWPIVQDINIGSPGHAEIDKSLILITKPDKPFTRAGKGTIMRFFTTKDYTEEIDELYANLGFQGDAEGSPSLSSQEPLAIRSFIRILAKKHMKAYHGDNVDFFELGFDSLRAARLLLELRNSLSTFIDPNMVNSRMIYRNPSIDKLSSAVSALFHRENPCTVLEEKKGLKVSVMKSLLHEYTSKIITQDFSPSRRRKRRRSHGRHILLTGSTGSLGAQILHRLLHDQRVDKIFCLDRSDGAEDKFTVLQKEIGRKWEKKRVHWFKADLADERFSLTDRQFGMLRNKVDVIIHNAWKVDFNHAVSSFKRQIQGVSELACFSIHSPRKPSLYFVSSIAAVGKWISIDPSTISIPETVPQDFDTASSMGYGESKLVSEHLLDHFANLPNSNVDFNILRVGQIAGPLDESGTWNRSEWFPSLMRTSKAIGAMPESLGSMNDIDWIPIDELARIVVEIIDTAYSGLWRETKGAKVYNLVNPSSLPFSSFVPFIRSRLGLNISVIPLGEWIKRLQDIGGFDESHLDMYPALQILDFYKSLDGGVEKPGKFETKNSERSSPGMRNLCAINEELLGRWMSDWSL